MTTAALPVLSAVFDALDASTALAALLVGPAAPTPVGLYTGVAPEGAALVKDYAFVVLGEPTESRFDALMAPGNDGTLRLHVYTADALGHAALQVYGALSAALDDVILPLDGHTLLQGRLTLETSRAETTETGTGRHLIARYAALTRRVA